MLFLKNYPELTEITKNPEYTLSSDEKVTNSITFKESEKFRVLGLDYSGKNSVTYAYSGNTKLLVTVLIKVMIKISFRKTSKNLWISIFKLSI